MPPTPKTIYIHVGMHKTGSTSVQFFFMSMRKHFIEKYGLYYPRASGKLNHRHKSLFPVDSGKFASIVAYARRADCHTIVISNETLGISGVSDACFAKIRAAAPEFAIKYIIYVRRIDELCKAWYSELRKTNNLKPGMTYGNFLDKSFRKKATIMFPSRLIERCSSQVGAENVIVRHYSPEALKNGDIVDDFCDIFGIALAQKQRPKSRYNVSPSSRALPYFTPSFFSSTGHGYSEMRLRRTIQTAFSYAEPGGIRPEVARAVAAETDLLERRYLPGYKRAFADKPLSLDFPELEADPYRIYIAELLHAIYRRVTWPERLIWRIGVFFYFIVNKVDSIHKLLLRLQPDAEKKKEKK